ncbi:hypothetical protein NL388_27475, partial [Klebsiella pneumoniae]|nr:hypothetical protein [Klebsiella pneumoniae]
TSRLTLDLTNLTDQPQTLSITLTAAGKLSLEGAQPEPVKLPPGARSTLFIPVRALEGYGDGEVTAQVTGLQLPGETFAPQQKSWKIGVRPAFPAQTVNTGTMLNPGESWSAPAQHIDGFSPATLQGQLLLSGKPPLNLARY